MKHAHIIKRLQKLLLPPYTKKDLFVVALTLLLLLGLPIAVILSSRTSNFFGQAAGSTSVEVENGTVAGNVTTVSDANASGGHFMRFGTVTPRMVYSLGVNPDQTLTALQTNIDHLQQVGANGLWVVAAFEWLYGSGSSTPSSTAIARFDNVIDEAKRRNLPLQVQIHGTPSWISAAGLWHGPTSTLSANGKSERQNWVECLQNFLNRTTPAGNRYADVITYAEIWNEPDDPTFWTPAVNANDYAQLVHDSTIVARQAAPKVKIAAPNTGRNALGFMGAFYDAMNTLYGQSTAQANKYWFDILGVHPYAGDGTGGFDPATDPSSATCQRSTPIGATNWCYLGYRLMHNLVGQREGAPKDIIVGEFGYTTTSGWFFVSESTRASYLLSALRLARNDGYIRQFTWYSHGTTGTDFNIHGTSTEQAFTTVATEP